MCDECKKLKDDFHNAGSIVERQQLYNIYDKQRKKCLKALGSLAPPAPAIEVRKERKPRKKKEAKSDDDDDPEPPMNPAKKASLSKKETDAVKKECKFYYRGGLCANSQMEKPFCPGLDKCPVK